MQLDYNLFLSGSIPANALKGYYDLDLLALSYIVAVIGSFVVLDLTGRIISESSKSLKYFWMLVCSVIMGCSIWCAHYVGMLAYKLPITMSYDPLWTMLSLIIAIIGSFAAFYFIKSTSTSRAKLILSGTFMGLCIASMYYVGLEAMENENVLQILYIRWIFLLSFGIAVIISIAAIGLLVKSNQGDFARQFNLKIVSAFVMAATIGVIHYIVMQSAVFIPDVHSHDIYSTIYSPTMEYYIAVMLGLMFFISLISSTHRQLLINTMQKNQAHIIQTQLEDKVKDRTAMLERKNLELIDALGQLNIIHNNLIHTEKLTTVGQLSAGIAHEINNPLSYTLSNMSVFQKYHDKLAKAFDLYSSLLEELNEDVNYKKTNLHEQISTFTKENNLAHIMLDIEAMLSESKDGLLRIKSIVSKLSSLTSTSSETTSIDVNKAIEDAINIAWNELKYKCNVIKKLTDVPHLNGSLIQFQLMIVDLLINAAQAIEKMGDITVSSSYDNSTIIITISDTGCGIPIEDIPKLFTPFFTTKPIGRGTGLGLASIYGVVKSLNGQIDVKSELGKGSIFTISLPVDKNG